MKSANPLVLSFDNPGDKGADLTNQVTALIHAHIYLVLAYPSGKNPPELSTEVCRISPILKCEEAQNMKRRFGLLPATSIEHLDTQEAQKQGFLFMDFYYNRVLLSSFGFQESIHSRLLQEPNREYRRSLGKIPILNIEVGVKKPATHIVEEYRRLLAQHLSAVRNK